MVFSMTNALLSELWNLVFKILHHFSTSFSSLQRPIHNRCINSSVYQWLTLPRRQLSKIFLMRAAFMVEALMWTQLVKLKTLWYICLSSLTSMTITLRLGSKNPISLDHNTQASFSSWNGIAWLSEPSELREPGGPDQHRPYARQILWCQISHPLAVLTTCPTFRLCGHQFRVLLCLTVWTNGWLSPTYLTQLMRMFLSDVHLPCHRYWRVIDNSATCSFWLWPTMPASRN